MDFRVVMLRISRRIVSVNQRIGEFPRPSVRGCIQLPLAIFANGNGRRKIRKIEKVTE